jgi:acyl-CoA synthetase (AMP-forming)/AMP-acid ligase II
MLWEVLAPCWPGQEANAAGATLVPMNTTSPVASTAIKLLTISDEERLQVDVEKLQTDISNMKSVSLELQEKDKQIQALEKKQEQFDQLLQSLIDSGQFKATS